MERTKEEQILILDTLIKERLLIISGIEDCINGGGLHEEYENALNDQLDNHKLALQEYKEGLEKIKQ